jgi:hypothetical protein
MTKELAASPVRTMRQAHKALLADLHKLEEATRSPSAKSAKELDACLKAAHTHVIEHFRLEERDGYFAAVRKRAPHEERTIQHLAEEHRQLEETLNGLLHASEKLDEAFRDKVLEWIGSMRDHEARENKLVQEVFYRDVAAED